MKKILFIFFIFLSVRGIAQIPDSVISIYNSARTNDWIQIGTPPTGFTVDTMFVQVISGVNYLMKDYNKGIFTTRELGIFPSAGSNLFRLQKAANHDSIKEITLDQFGGGIYRMSGTWNLNGKTLSKIGDSRLIGMTGADTIENGIIDVNTLTQLVDTNITFKNCKFVQNVSPAIYGADLSGVALATRALIKTMAIPGVVVKIPKNAIVRIDSTATLDRTSDFDGGEGVVRMSNYTMPALYFSGTVAGAANQRNYIVRVESSLPTPTTTQWNATNFIGAVFRNMNTCKINIVGALGFREGVRFIGDGSGFAYNNIIGGGNMQNNKIDFRFTQLGSGWCNENEMVGIPRCWVNSGVLNAETRHAVVIDNEVDYQNNSNKIYGLSVEKGAICVPIIIKDGYRNYIYGIRSETNMALTAVFQGLAADNLVTASYSGTDGTYIDTATAGTNIFVNANQMKTSLNTVVYPIYRWDVLGSSQQYDGTTISISGAKIFNTSGISQPSSSTIPIRPEYIELTSNAIGVGFENVSTIFSKIFLIKRNTVTGFDGRIKVHLKDSSGRDLGVNYPPYSPASFTYSSGGWTTTSNSSADLWVRVPSECASATVQVTRNGSNVRIRGLAIHSVAPATRSVILSYNQYRVAIQEPTTLGTYKLGDIIYNVSADTTTLGWQCDTSGTLRAISVSGSVAASSRNLVLASGHGVSTGEYLLINGVRNLVEGIAGDTAYLAVASAAFTGTITNAPAGFRRIGINGAGGGGGGSITLTGEVTGTGTGSVSTTISTNAVTYVKMQQMVATSVIGRSANSTGNAGAIVAGADGETLRRIGGVLGFGLLPWASIANVPNYYFTNPNLPDTNLVKLNDSTFLIKADRAPDTSVVKHTDTTVFFKLQSGPYSPSRSDPTNVASSSVESFFFERNGKVVGFSGTLKITPTSASPATTALDLALPLSPTFTATTDLGASGSVTTPSVTGNSWVFLINGRTSNGTARVSFTSTGNTEHVIFITGRFELK